jgi:uncharacterized membrane protein YdbT with pleckstrin-like domain
MRYIDQSLAPNEIVLQRGRWPAIFWLGAWLALIFLGIVLIGIYIFLRSVIIMNTTDFAVTNRRIILKRGWLNRSTQEIAVESVEGVLLNQSILGRIFGYGRVIVTGTGEATIVFPPMAHPVDFRRAIESARATGRNVHVVSEAEEERIIEETQLANENDHPREKPRRRSSFIGLRRR